MRWPHDTAGIIIKDLASFVGSTDGARPKIESQTFSWAERFCATLSLRAVERVWGSEFRYEYKVRVSCLSPSHNSVTSFYPAYCPDIADPLRKHRLSTVSINRDWAMSTNSDKQGQFGLSEIVRLKRVTDSPGKYRVRAPAEFTPSTDGSVSKALPGPWSFKNVHDYYAALAAPDQSREHFTNNRSSVRLAHPSGKSGACVHAFGTKYKPEDKQTYRGKEIKSFSTAYDAEKHSIHNASSAQGDESDTSAKAEVTTALTDGQDPVKRMLVDVILRQKGADEWVTMRDQGTFDLQISSPSSTERSASLKRSPLIKRVMTSSPVYAAYEEERLYSETDRLRKPTRLPSVCDLQFERLQCPEYRSQGFLVDPAKDDGYSCGLPQCVDRYRATFNYKASDMGDKDLSVINTERSLAEQTFAEDFVPPTAYTCGLRAAKVRHLNLDTEGDMQQFNTNVPGVYQHLHRYFTGDASDPVESVHVPDNASLLIGERKVKDGDEGVPVLAMLKKLPNAQDTEYGKSTYLHGQVWSAPTEASGGMWDVSKGSFRAIVSEPHERAEQATWARLAGSAYEARGATSSAVSGLAIENRLLPTRSCICAQRAGCTRCLSSQTTESVNSN